MLATKYLYEHLKRISLYLLLGINSGIVVAVFLGNLLYQKTDQSMLTPLLIFVAFDLAFYLPVAIWVIPED